MWDVTLRSYFPQVSFGESKGLFFPMRSRYFIYIFAFLVKTWFEGNVVGDD